MSIAVEKGKEANPPQKKYKPHQIAIALLGIIGMGLIMAFTPGDIGLTPGGIKALGILFLMVTWWICGMFPPLIPAISGIALMVVFQVTKIDVIFSGFSSTTVIFLIFAFVIAEAISKSGLGRRVAFTVMARSRPVYRSVLVLYSLLSILLSALIPSGAARTILMGTIGKMILPVFNQSEEKLSNVGRGFFTVLGLTSYMGSNGFITGGAAIILTLGLLQKVGVQVTYFQWMVLTLPALLIVAFVLALAVTKIFPAEVKEVDEEHFKEFKAKLEGLGPMSSEEKKVAVITAIVVLLWVIGDFIKVDYLTVGIVGGVVLMLPFISVITSKMFSQKLSWDVVYFCGSCLSLGTVLVDTKVAAFIAKVINPVMSSSSLVVFCLKLWLIATLVHFILPSAVSALSSCLPIIIASAQSLGFSIIPPVVVFLLCYTGITMVYQQTHSAIAFGFNQFENNDFMKAGLVTYVLWLIMTPLVVNYLIFLGY